MELNQPKPGRYVVAVSGGLDSVCLLDLLTNQPGYQLSVAHFDHGIRQDSAADSEFVTDLATKYNLPIIRGRGKLGPSSSEATARTARYHFLREAQKLTNSIAILTAHHQDDRLETLIINLVRGTGRRGISSISETIDIKRPLLRVSREELRAYAAKRSLTWREDPSNNDEAYLRNYIRQQVLPKLSAKDKQHLVELMDKQAELNAEIESIAASLLSPEDLTRLSLKTLNRLAFSESRELVASWLRQNQLPNFNHSTIERLTVIAKTKRPGTKIEVYGKATAHVGKDYLALYQAER